MEGVVSAPVGPDDGKALWAPSLSRRERANMTRYLKWLSRARGLTFADYDELSSWSVTELDAFWASIWDFFDVKAHTRYRSVLPTRTMPGATWFPGAELNYAEHALRRRDHHPAIIFKREGRPSTQMSYEALHRRVAAMATALRRLGIRPGDRVVGYVPNMPEAVVAFLAAAAVGAIWSSCPPEFGVQSVIDRFQQIEPKILFAVDGYVYGGKRHDRMDALTGLLRELPSVEHAVLIPYIDSERSTHDLPAAIATWDELMQETDSAAIAGSFTAEPVPFEHPLWILYSSGTTGLPKAIVQGHGGILLEHMKALSLHLDIQPHDRLFWFTTTGWMMWNFIVSGLLLGATVMLYDGHPAYPDPMALWEWAAHDKITYFGTSAAYIAACIRADLHPGRDVDLSALHSVGSTGSPLSPEGFRWVYDRIGRDVLLGSISGGTDMCTAVALSCPLLPVYAGEIQCRGLGAKVEAFDEGGRPVLGQVGELVITEPLPSMPLYFWNDARHRRYTESYFAMFPGVWRHGDWIEITSRGGCIIHGRSDSTLNRGGVRMGTADFYRVVESLPQVEDSLVVDTGTLDQPGRLLLFVSLRDQAPLTDALKSLIVQELRRRVSPRHVPDAVYAVPAIPRTLNGKKMEVPVKKILTGTPVEAAVSADAMQNPAALDAFVQLARTLRS